MYERHGITFVQARATAIHPAGREDKPVPYVAVESTGAADAGRQQEIEYDFLINATGPKLNFAATEGLGPDHNSFSVCTAGHAAP